MLEWRVVTLNYFNYFTQIEEHFWRKRGAHILVSPLDWAIVETWQKAGIPVEAVLRGIDRAFESYQRSRRGAGGRPLKSMVYCVDAVLDAAEELKEAAAGKGPDVGSASRQADTTFSREELARYFRANMDKLARAGEALVAPGFSPASSPAPGPQRADPFVRPHRTQGKLKVSATSEAQLAASLTEARTRLAALLPLLDTPGDIDLEDLERRLTVIEEKLTAALTAAAPDEVQLNVRREMDRALAPYRRKMTGEQLAALERQYMQKRLFEHYGVPRLSLFYLA